MDKKDKSSELSQDSSLENDWKDFALSKYQEVFKDMGHFSLKAANSNAGAGGIRLDSTSGIRQPYMAVRCLLGSGQEVALDYLKNAGSTATLAKQFRQAMVGKDPSRADQYAAIVRCFREATLQPVQIGTETLSPRLKQVLIPKPGAPGRYVALTPLSSAGLADRIAAWVKTHNDSISEYRKQHRAAHPTLRRLQTSQLGFGGSNPQNVGGLVRSLQKLVVATAPRESARVKRIFALFHREPELRVSRAAMHAYAVWRREAMRENAGKMPSNLAYRQEEADIVRAMARQTVDGFRVPYEQLQDLIDRLPDVRTPDGERSMFREDAPPHLKAIVEPSWRRFDWKRQVALEVARLIVAHRFENGTTLALDDVDREQIAAWIEEAL